ncbi:MAG: hypothetical protein ABI402_02070 [Ferruginibacter sp.]
MLDFIINEHPENDSCKKAASVKKLFFYPTLLLIHAVIINMPDIHFITEKNIAHKNVDASREFTKEVNISNNTPAIESSLLCYLDISINEMKYHFNAPSDLILYNENENAIIYFENEAATRYGWINFKNPVPDKADTIEFFEPGTGTFLILFKKSNSVYPVTLSEYSTGSEFICGHYSGIYTDAKDNPVYNVSCAFSIRRYAACVIKDNA